MTRSEYDSLIGRGNEIIGIFDGLCERYGYGDGRFVCNMCYEDFPDIKLLLRDLNAPGSEICDAINMDVVEGVHDMGAIMFLDLLFGTSGELMYYFYIDEYKNLCLDAYDGSIFTSTVTELITRAFVEGGYHFSFDDELYVFSGFSDYSEMAKFMMEKIYPLVTLISEGVNV